MSNIEKILLVSNEPQKWGDFVSLLSTSFEFIFSSVESVSSAIISAANVIAVDNIEDISKVVSVNKPKLPLVFFGKEGDYSTEIQVRKLGVAEYLSLSFDKELLLLRLKNLRANSNNVRWMRMIKNEMVSMQEGMAEVMAQMVESRDASTGGHIARTATFISILGDEFVNDGTLTRNQLNLIVMATPLHDIGKISVQDSILLKPGPLTDFERQEMMSHPKKGADLIQKMQRRFESHSYLKYAYDIALNHHERFDGKGYPSGKKGEEIPFCARLMAVIDVYDALVSDRVYRKGMPKDKAYEIIFSGRGTQFDPLVLEAFDSCKDFLI